MTVPVLHARRQAHDLGQVGDLLNRQHDTAIKVVPSIDEAIAALDGEAAESP